MAGLIDLNGLGHFKAKENAMVADAYSASKTYAVGDYVYYNGTLYRCTTAISTAEAWTAGHWTAAKLGDDCSALKTALNNMVIISNNRPSSEDNEIWIDSEATSVQVPTMEDLMKAFVEESTEKGSIANFTDGANGIPLKKIKVYGVPIQNGTGTPSTSNIRAITGGRTSCAINYSGADTTDYETLTVTFPQDAGTVYAFELTINDDGTGTLVKTHGYSPLPTTGWTLAGTTFWVGFGADTMSNTTPAKLGWCSHYESKGTNGSDKSIAFGYKAYSSSTRILLRDSSFTTKAALETYLAEQANANTPVQIVFPLATPVSYNLSVNQVMSILGENNIWSEAGDIETTYRADTKLYIASLS